jgi:hypothetical protein
LVRFLETVLQDFGERPDGSANASPSNPIFRALVTRNGGEVVPADCS